MNLRSISLAFTAFLLTACGGSDDEMTVIKDGSGSDDETTVTKDISLNVSAVVGATSVACGELTDVLVGTGNEGNGSAPNIEDFRLYVSDVQVATDDGEFVDLELTQNDWQHDNVALLDFEDATSSCASGTSATNKTIDGTLEGLSSDEYTRVRFTIGVPEALNHLDRTTAVSPLNIDGMTWSWAGGYKHMRLDVDGWNIHLGTTGCSLDDNNDNLDCSSARPNRPVYTFENIDTESSAIVFDYAALVEDSDITTDAGGATGCMSDVTDPECAALFTNLGLDVTTGECASEGCDSQNWVRFE